MKADRAFSVLVSDHELAFVATEDGYTRLVAGVEEALKHPDRLTLISCDVVDPASYDRALSGIEIVQAEGPNHFEVAGDVLRLRGSAVSLANFLANLPTGITQSGGVAEHHHYDAISFPEFVSPQSPEVVLILSTDAVPKRHDRQLKSSLLRWGAESPSRRGGG